MSDINIDTVRYIRNNVSYKDLRRLIELINLFPYKGAGINSFFEVYYDKKQLIINTKFIAIINAIAKSISVSPTEVIDLWIEDRLFINLPTTNGFLEGVPKTKVEELTAASYRLFVKQYGIIKIKNKNVFIVTYSDIKPNLCVYVMDSSHKFNTLEEYLYVLGDICESIYKEGYNEKLNKEYVKLRNTKKIIQLAMGISNKKYKKLLDYINRSNIPYHHNVTDTKNTLAKLSNLSGIDFDADIIMRILFIAHRELDNMLTLPNFIDGLYKLKIQELDKQEDKQHA